MTSIDTGLQVQLIPLEQIRTHHLNPRIDATAPTELVESVIAQGILEPLMVAPAVDDPDLYDLIDGHRRFNAAHQAGAPTVPAIVRIDLNTTAKQLAVMLVTGLQKAGLSPVEEAAGYEQLALAGMDDKAIAKEVGFSTRRVRERRRIARLPEPARAAVHGGQVTLAQVQALAEFDDDPATLTHLEGLLGTGEFNHQLHLARGARTRRADNQARVGDLEAAGAEFVAYDDIPATARALSWFRDEGNRSFVAHAAGGCLRWTINAPDLSTYAQPWALCTNPDSHDDPANLTATGDTTAEETGQRDLAAARAAREQRAAEAAAARAARIDWVNESLASLFPLKGHETLAGVARILMPLLVTEPNNGIPAESVLAAAFDVTTSEEITGHLAAASPAGALEGLVRYLAAVIVDYLETDPAWCDTTEEIDRLIALWDWVIGSGYQASGFDTRHVDQLHQHRAEIAAEDGAA